MRAVLLAAAVACAALGCKTTKEPDKIIVIENPVPARTNAAPMKAFSNETFIWENWFFSTNKVDKVK